MSLMCVFIPFLKFLIEPILAGYLFIFMVKLVAINKIKKFCGEYTHALPLPSSLTNIKFNVSATGFIFYLLNPIQNISLRIERIGDVGDWTSLVTSDIINIYHFQGEYTIKNKPQGGKDGWFDAYLFKKPNIRIALHLHYIDGNRWKEDEGYYIEKIVSNNK